MLIHNANVFLPEGRFSRCDLRFSEHIEALGDFSDEPGIDAEGCFLVPGLIDLHTHGAVGGDFSDADADLPAMTRHYAAHGVTGLYATAMTLPESALTDMARHVAAFTPGADTASILGIHLEGPFLSREKRGAQNADFLREPDMALLERVNAASGGRVRRVTLAPELSGASAMIARLSPQCRVSIGHTTADYDTALAAFSAGATLLTHLFNGMNGLHHRAPGVIGAAMDTGAFAELICDGQHVHPSAIRAAFRLFPDRIVLISDSLRCAGLPEGEYALSGQTITLRSGRCTLSGTDTLAGSVITVHDGLKNAVQYGVPLETAVAAATHNPARAMGLAAERGFLEPGLAADLVLLHPDLSLRAVYLRGRALR